MELEITPTNARLTIPVLVGGKERLEATEEMNHRELNEKIKNNDYELEEIKIETENGRISNVFLDIGGVSIEHYQEESEPSPPPIPEVSTEEMSSDEEKRYNSLSTDGTQANEVRNIIYNEKELTRGEIKKILQRKGFENVEVGEPHTGVNASLRLLDKYTDEIERDGRGESKTLRWVGR